MNLTLNNFSYNWFKLTILFLPVLGNAQLQIPEVILRTCHFTNDCVRPTATDQLDRVIPEGSGLTAWTGLIWTHNDSGQARLYALDSVGGKIAKTIELPGATNKDWEEISQDNHFLYMGDFGNNNGDRKQLQIYRLSKAALLEGKVILDSIRFQWPELRTSNEPKINFDCEAMVVMDDSIFLFTKEYKKRRCSRIFKIPAKPGNYTAEYVATLKTRLLVTGADYAQDKKRIVLCGYSLWLKPRLLVLNLPDSRNLKEITKGRKIRVKRKLQQIEGICSFNKEDYYLISEATNLRLWINKPKLYHVRIK